MATRMHEVASRTHGQIKVEAVNETADFFVHQSIEELRPGWRVAMKGNGLAATWHVIPTREAARRYMRKAQALYDQCGRPKRVGARRPGRRAWVAFMGKLEYLAIDRQNLDAASKRASA